MSISPWYVGQTLPVWLFTFTDDSNNAVNISGATLSLTIRNQTANTTTTGAGTFVITNAIAGQATYTLDASDVAAAGNFTVQAVATISGKPLKADPINWTIE